jgi:tRNA pseudouridine55 synthase
VGAPGRGPVGRIAVEKLIDRVLSVNKSAGVSTYDTIRGFKKLYKVNKIGHAGTLDPPATGLILLLTGEATKLSNYLMDLPKTYIANIELGGRTDTQDATGETLETGDWDHVTESDVRSVLSRFIGKREQVPPMYSALKHKGTPLYLLARKGQNVEREPRRVETYEIGLLEYDPPRFTIEVHCSRGLYLRVLAEEIGDALGVPSHLRTLVRTRIGHFDVDSAVPDTELGSFLEMDEPGWSLSDALGHLPAVNLNQHQADALMNGVAPRITTGRPEFVQPAGNLVRLLREDGRLGAIGIVTPSGFVQIRRVFREAPGPGRDR